VFSFAPVKPPESPFCGANGKWGKLLALLFLALPCLALLLLSYPDCILTGFGRRTGTPDSSVSVSGELIPLMGGRAYGEFVSS